MNVDIPDPIVEELKAHVATDERFETVEAYIEYLLNQVVKKLQAKKKQAYSAEDEKEVAARLKQLGYID